jgi:hypothetical protein
VSLERQRPIVAFHAANHVLEHHYRAVDQKTEVDGAQAHEVTGDVEIVHADNRDEHRYRNRQRHQNRGADISQNHQEDDDDEAGAFGQVLENSFHRGVDEIVAGVERADLYILRQIEGLKGLADRRRHVAAVRARQHHRHPDHGLLPAVSGAPQRLRMVYDNLANFAQFDRGAEEGALYRDFPDFIEVCDAAQCTNNDLLAVALYVSAAVILSDRIEALRDLLDGKPVLLELTGIDIDMDFFRVTTEGIDIGDTLDALELPLDDIVLNRTQVNQAFLLGLFSQLAFGFCLHDVEKHLAETRRKRREFGYDADGKRILNLVQAFADLLSREVDIRVFFKDDDDERETVLRNRADLLDFGDSLELGFNDIGDGRLNLLRVERPRLCDNHRLDVGDIGHRIDGQFRRRKQPGDT